MQMNDSIATDQQGVYSLLNEVGKKGNFLWSLIYLLLITSAEITTTFFLPSVGLLVDGLLFIGMLLHASFTEQESQQRFLLAFALAPLIRLLSLSIPLTTFPFVYWYLIIGTPLLLAAFLTARVMGVKRTEIGLNRGHLLFQLLIGLSGLGLGYLEYLILRPESLLPTFTWGQFGLTALILLFFTGFLEEYIFRGLMQHAALKSLGWWGLLYVSALFAVLHIGYQSSLDVLFVFVVGLFFSLVVYKTNSLLGVSLAHCLTNISLFIIFPLLEATI
jgi:membrane protease YdiL (CAAX protease family)